MSIVTKTGDHGETGLFGGQRVSKANIRIQTYGTVDELNALLGIIRAENQISEKISTQLLEIQNILFRMGADLATPRVGNANPPRIEQVHIDTLEKWITDVESILEIPQYFVLPGGSKGGSMLHLARTVCRRAERESVALSLEEDIGPYVIIYLNRLSDYFFLIALQENKEKGQENIRVTYF